MKRLTILTLVALFFAGGSIFAQPQNGAPAKGQMFGVPGEMMKSRLNLTEEQSKKFDEIIFSQREAAIDTRAEVQKLKLKMQKAANAGEIDINRLKKINAQISSLQLQQKDRRLETWAKINEILTPEQKKTWKLMLNKMMSPKRGKMHKGRGMKGKKGYGRMMQ